MIPSSQLTNSQAAAELPRNPWPRFSLLTLLAATTLAGFVFTIIFSPHWDADERLLLAFWCAGLILGVSLGKARGSRGVLSGSLGGAVGCVLAAMIVLNRFEDVPEGAARYSTVYLAFDVTLGSLAALVVAGGYQFVSSGAIERIWQSRRARLISLLVLGCVASGLIVWQLVTPRWQPSWQIDLQARKKDFPTLQISPTGQFLFAQQWSQQTFPKEREGSMFEFKPSGVIRRPAHIDGHVISYVLSPDGHWLADAQQSNLAVFDTLQGGGPRFWRLQVTSETVTRLQFNATSDRLLVTTTTPRIQRLYVIDPLSEKLPQPELFPFQGSLLLDPTGEVLVKLKESPDVDLPQRVEVVRRSDGQLLGEMHDVPGRLTEQNYRVAPRGEFLSRTDIGGECRVWKLNAKSSTAMPGVVRAFTDDGRAIVHSRQMQSQPAWLPTWLLPMPFVRHAYDLKNPWDRLLVVDLATGETLAATAPLKYMLEMQAADQGNVIVGATFPEAYTRIWQVPPRPRAK